MSGTHSPRARRATPRAVSSLTLGLLFASALAAPAAAAPIRRPTRLQPQDAPAQEAAPAEPVDKEAALRNAAGLPMAFEENQGQTDARARYLARGRGYTVFLTPDSAVLSLSARLEGDADTPGSPTHGTDPSDGKKIRRAAVALHFDGADPSARVVAEDPLEAKSNYLIGADPTKWQTDIANYQRVRVAGLYPGVDVVYYGTQGQFEYDFVVAPGASPDAIRMRFEGADSVTVDDAGELVIEIDGRTIKQRKPSIYQQGSDGAKTAVAGGYSTDGFGGARVEVGGYDASRPLVVDPALLFSTFLGGSITGNSPADMAYGVAIAGSSAIVVGSTNAADFPTTAGAFARLATGALEAFVVKMSADGSTLAYSTYLGGSNDDVAYDVAIDAAGAAYVTGSTASGNFPTTTGAVRTTYGGIGDSFVAKLNPTGSSLIYSTFLGGSAQDAGYGIAVDGTGAAYVTGYTRSRDFLVTAGAFDTTFGGTFFDTFVSKINAAGTALQYSTYIGGGGSDTGNKVAVDAGGSAYVVGSTDGVDFPTTSGAFDRTFGGALDGFVTKLNPSGSALTYSTLLGGASGDQVEAIALDASGAAYVTGGTSSSDFPATTGAFDTSFQEGGFVTKLNPSASALVFSTFFAGGGSAIKVDSAGSVYIAGAASISGIPTTAGAFDTTFNGNSDAFVTKFNSVGSALLYSTYLGGGGSDSALGLAVDATGAVFVVGFTNATDFPTTASAYDTSANGDYDAFVTKINASGNALVYSTLLGGVSEGSLDVSTAVAVDASGAAYVVGSTLSIDFPTSVGAYDSTLGGLFDGTVTKLNAAGNFAIYSTYLGGAGSDVAHGIAVDTSGAAYIVGSTSSADFPRSSGAFDTTLEPFGFDGFVTKLNAAGSGIVYSSYLGGTGSDQGYSVAVDGAGSAYVTGTTSSSDFPTTVGAFDTTSNGGYDVFVTKVNSTGTGLIYSSYLGGSTNGLEIGFGIVVDASGNASLTGYATSPDFPTTPGAYDTTYNGGTADAFVARLNSSGSALLYSTFLGGALLDYGESIAVDSSGAAYVVGFSQGGFPTTPGTYDSSAAGAEDAFVTKLSPSGAALIYSTLLGGGSVDEAYGIVVDGSGDACVAGLTRSADFPTTGDALDGSYNGGESDVFLSKLNPTGTALLHSTLLGGSGSDMGAGIALSPSGWLAVTGQTTSGNFPTTSGAFDTSVNGGVDGFVLLYCVGDEPPPTITAQPLSQTINRGQTATLSVTATTTSGLALSYQWYRGESGFTGDVVAGATSPTLVTPPLQSTTKFWVRISDTCGVFTDSASATVTVLRAAVPVTTTADSGAGSLRQAILNSNADPGTDAITFNLAAPFTISVASALPPITEPIVVDGLSQPGSSPGHPLVVLSGPGAGAGQSNCADDTAASFDGLHLASTAAGSVIRGLVINAMPGDGIELQGGGDAGHQTLIQSCFVGTNAAGSAAVLNGRHGVYANNASYSVIGGDRAADGSLAFGDLLSGNHCSGVEIKGGLAANNTVIGCNVGPDVSGLFPVGNLIGIEVDGAPNTVIGAAGDDAGKRNVCGFCMSSGVNNTGNISTKLGVLTPPNTVVLGTTFSGNGGGSIVGGAAYAVSLTSATISASTLSVVGSATVPANRQYRVQYFSNTTCSSIGGQGEVLIAGDVLKQSSPSGTLDLTFASAATTVRPGELVAATVTGTEGTSNFSFCQTVSGRLGVVAERAAVVAFTSLPASGASGGVEQGVLGGGNAGTPALDRTFAGPRDSDDPDVSGDEVVPPDPQAAVGPTQLLSVTNAEIAVASKSDGSVARRVSVDALWAGLVRTPAEPLLAFNPRATYDALAGHFVVVATANPRATSSAVLLAVSKTSDALGLWNVYRYDAEGADVLWADYPTLGFTKDWIAVQVNMTSIAFSNVIVRSDVYLVDKAAAYAGAPGTGKASVLGRATTDTGLGVAFGATQMPATTYDAAASTLWLAQTGDGNTGGVGTVRLYKVTGAVGAETLSAGPAFTTASTWFTNQLPYPDLAPQAGTAQKIQINDTRMQAVVFRNGHVYLAHTVLLPAVTPTHAAVQWWEADPAGAGTVVQRGRVDSGTATEMEAHPSLAVTASGAIVVGYSRFTTTTFGSSAYRYRAAGDAAGTLRGEVLLKAGEAKYVKTLGGSENRWGDYSSATVDPSDGERVWLLGEYAESPRTGAGAPTDQWGVWWGSLHNAPIASPGADTVGVYSSATGTWFLRNSNSAGGADLAFGFGPAGSALVPLRGDWNGDGVDTPGLYDPSNGTFFLKNTSGPGAADVVFTFGAGGAGVVPVTGDFDGNGTDTVGIYVVATGAFFLKNTNASGNADVVFSFGAGGANVVPLFGDYDGNGTDTVGLYNQTTGAWFLKNTNAGGGADVVFTYGPSGAGIVPLVGDYDGNGTDTIGVYVAGTGAWFLKNANAAGNADLIFTYGPTNLTPLVGDWDGL